MTTIKAILINPFAQFLSKRVEEIDLEVKENGDLILSELYKYLDCDLIDIVNNWYADRNCPFELIVDEEGLLKENTFFKIKDFGQEVFAGKGILVQINKEGKFIDIKDEEDIKDLTITFPSVEEAIIELNGGK